MTVILPQHYQEQITVLLQELMVKQLQLIKLQELTTLKMQQHQNQLQLTLQVEIIL